MLLYSRNSFWFYCRQTTLYFSRNCDIVASPGQLARASERPPGAGHGGQEGDQQRRSGLASLQPLIKLPGALGLTQVDRDKIKKIKVNNYKWLYHKKTAFIVKNLYKENLHKRLNFKPILPIATENEFNIF